MSRALFLPAILLAVSVSFAASAQAPVTKGVIATPGQMTHTCKDPNPGNIFREPDGGYHESAQGWFSRAEVHQGTGWALAYCYYGLDKAAPANRPVYSVHYEMTGFKSNQCSVAGKTVTCGRIAVLKESK
jgi:hypothetical protein